MNIINIKLLFLSFHSSYNFIINNFYNIKENKMSKELKMSPYQQFVHACENLIHCYDKVNDAEFNKMQEA